MGVIAQYEVSPTNPSVVGGAGAGIKYFGNTPTNNSWNFGIPGSNPPQDSRQFSVIPSATSALGQLPCSKLPGGRFRMYASGSASSAATPTIQPSIQVNLGTVQSPNYQLFINPASLAALAANKPVAWSITAELMFDTGNFEQII